ncbi:MAG: hypothetical protein ACE5LU_19360 [Anaerolineae bacterium]
MKTDECRRYLDTWLRQVEAIKPDTGPALEAARHVATCAACGTRLRRIAQALNSTVEDRLTCDACQAQLADYVHAQAAGTDTDRFADVRDHLALCPFCAEAFAQVYEWVLASLADAVPVAESYPAFELPFLAEAIWSDDVVRRAIEQGRQWIQDALGAVYVLLGPGLQAQPAVAWVTKSGEPGALLYQTVLEEEAAPGWEIEVSAFMEDEATCRVEVALYRPGAPDAELAGVPITLWYEQVFETAETDAGGVAEFASVLRSKLDQIVVRVAPTDE